MRLRIQSWLVPVFTIRPAFPTSVKKVNTSFKNVWRTWGPTLLADLMIFCPLGPMNFKNSDIMYLVHLTWAGFELTMLVIICTDCIGSCISNYHTITTMAAAYIKSIRKYVVSSCQFMIKMLVKLTIPTSLNISTGQRFIITCS